MDPPAPAAGAAFLFHTTVLNRGDQPAAFPPDKPILATPIPATGGRVALRAPLGAATVLAPGQAQVFILAVPAGTRGPAPPAGAKGAGGPSVWTLQVDPANVVREAIEANNTAQVPVPVGSGGKK